MRIRKKKEKILIKLFFSYIQFKKKNYLKSLRETSVEGVQLERALQRIESLQNQLRNMEPVITEVFTEIY